MPTIRPWIIDALDTEGAMLVCTELSCPYLLLIGKSNVGKLTLIMEEW